MFRKIVLALTATAALSAAALAPTASSAYPVPRPHVGSGSPGGVGFVGFPYVAGVPGLPGTVLACQHIYSFHGWHNVNCHWVFPTRAGR
jgi:hypothetical protein